MKSRETPLEDAIRLPDILPVLPLKDAVLYPFIIVPLSLGRESSIRAVDQSLAESRMVLLVAQRDARIEEPEQSDLYTIGTAASIMRMLKLPDGRIRLLVQGVARVRLEHLSRPDDFPQARIEPIAELPPDSGSLATQALVRSAKESMDRIVGLGKGVSPEVLVLVANLEDPGRLADLIASNLELAIPDAQRVLETIDGTERLQDGDRLHAARDPAADHAAGDLFAGARRDRPQSARVLSAPAVAGDSDSSWARTTSSPRRWRGIAAWPRRRTSRTRRRKSSSARSAGSSVDIRTARKRPFSAPTSTGSPAFPGRR